MTAMMMMMMMMIMVCDLNCSKNLCSYFYGTLISELLLLAPLVHNFSRDTFVSERGQTMSIF